VPGKCPRIAPSPRLQLVLPTRSRSRSGFLDGVVISAISEGSCRIDSLELLLRQSNLVAVRPMGWKG
jgi:hypothetical protein